MNLTIEDLFRLQDIDTKCDLLLKEKEKLLKEVKEFKALLDKEKKEFNEISENLKEKEKLRKQKEKDLKYEEEVVKRWESRLKEIKKQREYQALIFEIAQAKKANAQLEEEILKILEEEENLRSKKEEKEKLIFQMESDFSKKEEEIQRRLNSIKQELEQHMALKGEIVKKIDPNLLSRYNLIRQKRSGLAVVFVENGICKGCNMNVPPQIFYEVMKNDKIISCPHCQRILYYQQRKKETGGETSKG